jgi:glycylpeptide N-tetradecanoyltransferase
VYEEAEFAHWLLPREGVIDSFVVEASGGGGGSAGGDVAVTDMISFYHLPSTVIGERRREARGEVGSCAFFGSGLA